MNALPMKPLQPGLVSIPGATPESTAFVAEVLYEDFMAHHCFYNERNRANHLSHHYERPLHLNGTPANEANKIDETNWTSKLGKENANIYPQYLSFFSTEIAKHGVSGALEHYVFSSDANANGTLMLARFIAGVLHPLIETGFGIEFGQDFMVAQGLAQAALTAPLAASVMDSSGVPEIDAGRSTTLLSLLDELYDSPEFSPMPNATERSTTEGLEKWVAFNPDRIAAIRNIYAKWTFQLETEDFGKKVEECMWQATLLLGATGKVGREPQMDFYLMHFLTGSLSLGVIVDAIRSPLHKAQLLQTYARTPNSMSGTVGHGSPWLALLNNATMHTEPHVVKSIRALFYYAQKYGGTPAGGVIGALDGAGKETHQGTASLDGTLFVRVAGTMTNAVGWVTHGENERFWDFSGWEED
ncbi:hypothetical protein C8F04DRAFT_1121261 [Mycena alexandri]|uniref:Uncharacterized protein n=1 Tax=Mycena alexandri TaxID=1745969 RepID=A0AAD6SJ19_9AGAR|nr:hypothetical protein C8F04DRAFT_1121261 [Mycena alexandri]